MPHCFRFLVVSHFFSCQPIAAGLWLLAACILPDKDCESSVISDFEDEYEDDHEDES
jgi:hypothetical protein